MSKLHKTLELEPSNSELYDLNDGWELGGAIVDHGDYCLSAIGCQDQGALLKA